MPVSPTPRQIERRIAKPDITEINDTCQMLDAVLYKDVVGHEIAMDHNQCR